MRIHPVVNVSQIVQYKEQVKEQKKEKTKLIEVERVKEQKVEKILNKRKIRGVEKYLVCWKGFTAEYDIQEREENLGVKIEEDGLDLFSVLFIFYFIFDLFFYFQNNQGQS